MELDDLKQTWKAAGQKQVPDTDIRELLQNPTGGPIARLSRTYRRRMVLLPLALALVIMNFGRHHNLVSNPLFWLYVGLCTAMMIYFYLSYRLVRQMQQQVGGQVREVLMRQVRLLERSVQWRLLIVRVMAVVFIVLYEVMMWLRHGGAATGWYTHPAAFRIGVYAALWLGFFFLTGFLLRHQYGRHIRRLKELVQQMEQE